MFHGFCTAPTRIRRGNFLPTLSWMPFKSIKSIKWIKGIKGITSIKTVAGCARHVHDANISLKQRPQRVVVLGDECSINRSLYEPKLAVR